MTLNIAKPPSPGTHEGRARNTFGGQAETPGVLFPGVCGAPKELLKFVPRSNTSVPAPTTTQPPRVLNTKERSPLDFQVGQKVIYPNHGIGVVESIQTRAIPGVRSASISFRSSPMSRAWTRRITLIGARSAPRDHRRPVVCNNFTVARRWDDRPALQLEGAFQGELRQDAHRAAFTRWRWRPRGSTFLARKEKPSPSARSACSTVRSSCWSARLPRWRAKTPGHHRRARRQGPQQDLRRRPAKPVASIKAPIEETRRVRCAAFSDSKPPGGLNLQRQQAPLDFAVKVCPSVLPV